DLGHDAVQVALHVLGPQPQDHDAERLEQRLTVPVSFLLEVVNRAVDFDGQPGTGAVEIDDEGTYWLLPAEPDPGALSPKGLPEPVLRSRRLLPELARPQGHLPFEQWIDLPAFDHPSPPAPSPTRGRGGSEVPFPLLGGRVRE